MKKPSQNHLKKVAEPKKAVSAETEEAPVTPTKHAPRRKPKALLIAIGAVIVVAAAVALFLVLVIGKSNQAELETKLRDLASDFYANFYYSQLETAYDDDKLKEFLAKYTETGIKINLDNLSRYSSENYDTAKEAQAFVNNKTDEKCDLAQTQATIYPQSPFSKNDFDITVQLSCGFSE